MFHSRLCGITTAQAANSTVMMPRKSPLSERRSTAPSNPMAATPVRSQSKPAGWGNSMSA